MNKRLVSISMLLMLLISTIPLILDAKTVEASVTGPSLIVDDTLNQIHATLGAMAGSAVTVKGTVINHAAPPPGPGGWLTGVFYREIGGPGITPPDLTLLWSLDGVTWWPAGPILCPTWYLGYDLELIIGAGGYYIPVGFNSTTYIKTITNRIINPTDVEVIVFEDTIINSRYDPGEPILSIGGLPVEVRLSIWNTAELDPVIPMFFSTIQAAIQAATPGQTIYVYSGLYALAADSPIRVNKAITLTGDIANPSNVVVKAPPSGAWSGRASCFVVSANNVVIQGFHIQDAIDLPPVGPTNKQNKGIWIGHTGDTEVAGVHDVTISHNEIHNCGDGIMVAYAYNIVITYNDVWSNIITNYYSYSGGKGIVVYGNSAGATLPRNILIDHNRVHNNELWGIQLNVWNAPAPDNFWFNMNTTISNNVIYNNGGPFDHYGPGTNYDCGFGIISNGHTTGVIVKNNEIYGHTTGTGSRLKSTTSAIRAIADKGWTIRNNMIHDNFRGIYLYGSGYGLPEETTLHVVEYNEVYSNAEGIVVSKSDAGHAQYNNIHDNDNTIFVGDGYGPYGLRNLATTGTFDARFNWWGDASGPTHSTNTGGIGDTISNNVDYSPWLGFVVGTSPMTWHVNPTGGSDAIQEAVDEASDGDTIIAHAGTYYESQIIVDKSLRVLGSSADTTAIDGGNAALSNVGLVRITANTGDVTFSDFSLTNAGPAGTVRVGIYASSDTAGLTYTISNNKIYGTNADDPDDYGFYSNGGKERLIFTNNLITQTGANPILFELHTGETEVSYNTLDEGFYGSTVYFSMTYGGVDITTPQKVHHNTIDVGTGFHTGSDYWSGGIAFNSASHYATGNGTYTNVQITDNVISNMKGYRRGISSRNDASGDGSGGEISSPIIARNTITGIAGETESIGIQLAGLVTDATVSNNNIIGTYLGIFVQNADPQICNNTITDFIRGGIVIRDSKDILLEGNIISTTLHDEAPNGIDIGTYSGTTGTIRGNEISGCSWNGFTGDYDTSWSGSGILVIESGDSLKILGNIVHDCDVGMDIESDSMNITCNEVYDNVYGFVFWNTKPKVNYNNIYNNTQYGVYRTAMGDLTGVLDARYNWWGHASGPTHPSNPGGTGDAVSDNVSFAPWLLQIKVPPLVHDVAVVSVVSDVAHQYPGRIVNITVVVKNNGNMYETFNVTVYRNTTAIGTILVTDLGIGENTTLIFNWNTTGLTPCNRWTISAKAPIVGDVNPSDNNMTDGTVKIKMIGDVNADGIVDIFDIVACAVAFGATPSDPNWNPQAELFEDGIIDIFDLVTIAMVFGNTCP